jgi:hypothetical protein
MAVLRNAVGVWFDTFPLTPDRVRRRKDEAGFGPEF